MCTSSPTSVPGRSLANGPQSERSPTLASSIYTCGPMRHSAPIWVAPLRTVNGSITVSWPTVTVASTNVLSGSTMDAAQHQALEQPAAHDVCRPREPDAVLDPH